MQYTKEQLSEILKKHKAWRYGEAGGERADLREANLRGANLCEADLCEADLRGANLCEANLCGANLRGANLCEADLCEANLCEANLCEADLREANLNHCAGNKRQIKSLFISEKWAITYTAEYLQIGCQRHKFADWWGFDDATISKMDISALMFWREMKDFIKMTVERFPAVKTGKEQ